MLNACTLSGDWKGVSWVFLELRGSGLQPSGATYGLAMEVLIGFESLSYNVSQMRIHSMRSVMF